MVLDSSGFCLLKMIGENYFSAYVILSERKESRTNTIKKEKNLCVFFAK